MKSWQTVAGIAGTETKLLLRSWGFRIFAGLTIVFLGLAVVILVLPAYPAFYFIRALPGALPVIVMKLLNVLQGVMAVFLASEFLKRDRRLDTSQVVFSQSFSNGQYAFGKFLGIFGAFMILDAAIFLVLFGIHLFLARTPSSGTAALLAFGVIGVPTLVFMIGLTMFLGYLVRNQAAAYLLALSYAMISLVVVGPRYAFVFDAFAFHTPVFRSDFIGLGNTGPLVLLRGGYLALGLALVLASSLVMKRLGQSPGWSRLLGGLAFALAGTGLAFGIVYLQGVSADRRFRVTLTEESQAFANEPALTLGAADIRVRHEGTAIAGEADLTLLNGSDSGVGSILLHLNPGLAVTAVRGDSGPLSHRQTRHLVVIEPVEPVPPGGEARLSISYGGTIDERFCYLDIDEEILETPLKIWFLAVPKRSAFVSPELVHLTPECGWYPRPGLPQSLLFPHRVKQDFSRYTLTVEAPDHLVPVSQGIAEASGDGSRIWTFRPKTPLPHLSLTLGRYEAKSLEVDGVRYGLFLLEGHDRFTSKFDEIGSDLPGLITRIKDTYEVGLGLNYPYETLSLVEVPLQMVSYDRLWTTAQENVQPQLVFLPEMGVLNPGAEFRMGRGFGQGPMAGARQRGREISPADLQRQNFNRFIQANLIGTQVMAGGPLSQRGPFGIQVETNSEARFGIFPNYLSFMTSVDTPDWPLLGYALETYLEEQANPQAGMAVRGMAQGLLGQEEINSYLLDHSLADLLSDPGRGSLPVSSLLQAKAESLVLLIRSKLEAEDFDERLAGLVEDHVFRPIRREEVIRWIADMGTLDLDRTFAEWYEEQGLPGFIIDDVQGYEVVDGERTKFQVKFRVSNPTDLGGVLLLTFATRGGFGDRAGGAAGGDNRAYYIPPRTVKDVGILLDEVAFMATADTSLSRNLPSVLTLTFMNRDAPPDARPFEGEESRAYVPPEPGAGGVYVVDNEDSGFDKPAPGKASWLRRFIRDIFIPDEQGDDPAAIPALARPPDEWQDLVLQNFYGGFVRSGVLIKSGSGSSRVSWTADIKEPGSYDIYFYNEGIGGGMGRFNLARMARGGGQRGGSPLPGIQQDTLRRMGRRMRPGERHYIVHHEDGSEEIIVDLDGAPAGWNHLGEFRLLAGRNSIELTDQNEERYVIADAVKWVRKN